MKKFQCTVTRTDEYIIEIDENVINNEWMQEFRKAFYDFTTLEEHAQHLAQLRARFGEGFSEGYGNVKINGRIPWYAINDSIRELDEDAINIIVLSEDENGEIEVEEI